MKTFLIARSDGTIQQYVDTPTNEPPEVEPGLDIFEWEGPRPPDGSKINADGEIIPPSADDIKSAEVSKARAVREKVLQSSDWTQLPDSPVSPEKREAWSAYRQAVRDLPSMPDWPHSVWPTPPI